MKTAQHPLTQRGFRSYLKGRPANEVIGKANEPTDCPCNRCIAEQNPQFTGKRIEVQRNNTLIYQDGLSEFRTFANTRWMKRFINTVDNRYSYQPITVAMARSIFRKATRPGQYPSLPFSGAVA